MPGIQGAESGRVDRFQLQREKRAVRLQPGSPGRGAGEGGRDLGATADLVGPGPAYDYWKRTPEYREWLNTTGQRP